MTERRQLEDGIAALEAQRALLGDVVVDASLAALRAKLDALDGTRQQLKQVAVLFVDVVGSTALSQRLDPEAIAGVLDGALERAAAVVRAHGGRVMQFAGDSVLAAFGADEAREDDGERAVRCGLALLALGRVLADEVAAAHGHAGFDVRVGIHTGGVLLGSGVDADASIRGVAVHIAARMEQTAPAGALRISHDTYAQVRGLFEVVVQEPLAVKGVDEPVQSYLVVKAKPRTFRIPTRGIEGVATRMVGRDAELETLRDAYRRLLVERRLAALTVVADAGVGKSRLLHEFESWCETRPEIVVVFRGRASPYTRGQPFGLLRDVLAWRFQIADDDALDAARAKLVAGIVPLFDDDGAEVAEGNAHVLGHLIGIEWRDSPHVKALLDDPRQISDRAFHVVAELFRRWAAREGHPLVLQLEDLHWSDRGTLDLLAGIVGTCRDVPLLIVASSRPTLFEDGAAWCPDELHRRVDLTPLDRDASRSLVDELLRRLAVVPDALREIVTGGAEGNPFYMEELVKMLIDRGAIATGDPWTVDAERLLGTSVPSTLTGVLQARLDGLPAVERLTLQEASVIGQVFWDRALFALDAAATETLPALVARELALPRADAPRDGMRDLREYAFKHALLHQVTYATVLRQTRRVLHGRLAHWLVAQSGSRANDLLGIAAMHFEEAGEDANAAEFHARAAEEARSRLAHETVATHVTRGLALSDRMADADTRRVRWRLLRTREATLNLQGDRVAQRNDLDAMQALAEALDDDACRARVAVRRGVLAMRTADYPACESAARDGVAAARRAGDDAERLMAQRLVAAALERQGRYADAKALANETLAEARDRGLRSVEGHCLNVLFIVADAEDAPVEKLALAEQALVAHRSGGNRRAEAIDRANLASAWLDLGDLARARRETEEALSRLRANGDRAMQCAPLCNLATIAWWEGDADASLRSAHDALETARAVYDRFFELGALWLVGNAELALDRRAAARESFETMHRAALASRLPQHHGASLGLARVALAEADGERALAAIAPLLGHAGESTTLPDGIEFPRLAELTCHEVLARAGNPRATAWLRCAHDAIVARLERIDDAALRRSYVAGIPHHRAIVAAWESACMIANPARASNDVAVPTPHEP